MDRLKQLADQAHNIDYSGPTVHPACPAPYRAFMAAATPAAIISLYDRLEASDRLTEQTRHLHELIDGIAQGVEDKVRSVHDALSRAQNMPEYRIDREAE